MPIETLLKPTQVADVLGIKTVTLDRWRQDGCGPEYVKVGRGRQRLIRYHPADVKAFIEEGKRKSTSDPGPAANERPKKRTKKKGGR